jgi:regulatory protein
MIVTKIERQNRNPQRFNLYLDGTFAFGIHRDVLSSYGTRTGDELSETLVSEMKAREEVTLAQEAALRLLSYRRRSEHEILLKLREKEFPPAVIQQVIGKLQDSGLLNDLEYAKAYIHDRQLKKPTGTRLLEQELRLRGVLLPVVREAIGQSFSGEEQLALAHKAASQALKRHSLTRTRTDPAKQRQKVAGALSRRGFPWDVIHKVLKQIFGRSPDEEEI